MRRASVAGLLAPNEASGRTARSADRLGESVQKHTTQPVRSSLRAKLSAHEGALPGSYAEGRASGGPNPAAGVVVGAGDLSRPVGPAVPTSRVLASKAGGSSPSRAQVSSLLISDAAAAFAGCKCAASDAESLRVGLARRGLSWRAPCRVIVAAGAFPDAGWAYCRAHSSYKALLISRRAETSLVQPLKRAVIYGARPCSTGVFSDPPCWPAHHRGYVSAQRDAACAYARSQHAAARASSACHGWPRSGCRCSSTFPRWLPSGVTVLSTPPRAGLADSCASEHRHGVPACQSRLLVTMRNVRVQVLEGVRLAGIGLRWVGDVGNYRHAESSVS